jgi:muramoyltetrapeptide carboxypeptidase
MLKKNQLIDVVSIASPCDSAQIVKIKNFLLKNCLKAQIFLEKETAVKSLPNHEFAIIDAEIRFQQLKKAINSNSKIIWCARGGYGSAEILPFLQKMTKPKTEKIFIGFSDIASINLFLMQNWNWQTITAPVLLQLVENKVSKKSQKAILDLIFGKTEELKYKLKNLSKKQLDLEAKITGGCVSVIAGNFATKNQINWHNKILFLEDEGEDGERLDRYFYQIATIIKESKKKPKAILLGNFLQANLHGTPRAKNILIAIEKLVKNLPEIAIYQEIGGHLGHSFEMLPLILNKNCKIKNNILTQKI